MLARRLRRRTNINPALGQCIVFAGLSPLLLRFIYFHCAGDDFPTDRTRIHCRRAVIAANKMSTRQKQNINVSLHTNLAYLGIFQSSVFLQ